jgi:hypothetical protein
VPDAGGWPLAPADAEVGAVAELDAAGVPPLPPQLANRMAVLAKATKARCDGFVTPTLLSL